MSTPVPRSDTDEPTSIQVTTIEPTKATNGPGTPAASVPSEGLPAAPASAGQDQSQGVGTEGEVSVWIGRYSFKNFVMRLLVRTVVTVIWLCLLVYLGDRLHTSGQRSANFIVWGTGAALAVFWLMLGWQILLARLGHLYELTNRRLFVDTGVFRRRRDQIELLKVQDVYVKQEDLLHRLLDVGTVVIESSEERLPVHYLAGVSGPKDLMDLIWHHARKERDLRSVKVDEV